MQFTHTSTGIDYFYSLQCHYINYNLNKVEQNGAEEHINMVPKSYIQVAVA